MTKKFKPTLNLNFALQGTVLKVVGKGVRTAYTNSAKSKDDVAEFPDYVRVTVTRDPTGVNTDAELQIKLHSAENVEVGQKLEIGPNQMKIVDGQLVFWSNKSTYHGRDWIFTNVSAKGDRIDAWN